MRRRHLDSEKRRELVRNLHREQKMSLRRIATITGWSKSTIDRDLKESPFEAALKSAGSVKAAIAAALAPLPKQSELLVGLIGDRETILRHKDSEWKRGSWPPPIAEHVYIRFLEINGEFTSDMCLKIIKAKIDRDDDRANGVVRKCEMWSTCFAWYLEADDDERAREAEKNFRHDGDDLIWVGAHETHSLEEAAELAKTGRRFWPPSIARVPNGTDEEDES